MRAALCLGLFILVTSTAAAKEPYSGYTPSEWATPVGDVAPKDLSSLPPILQQPGAAPHVHQILQAAECLEQAGMADKAKELRQRAQQEARITLLFLAAEHLRAANLIQEADELRQQAICARLRLANKSSATADDAIPPPPTDPYAGSNPAARVTPYPCTTPTPPPNYAPACSSGPSVAFGQPPQGVPLALALDAPQVLARIRVFEVSRTKLRDQKTDLAALLKEVGLGDNVTGTTGGTARFGCLSGDQALAKLLERLQRDAMARTVAEPAIVTVSGQPAQFVCGGMFPMPVMKNGTMIVEYKPYGTEVDLLPVVRPDRSIRLEIRFRLSEIDPKAGVEVGGVKLPGVRAREFDTGVELKPHQTLVVSGLTQIRISEAKPKADGSTAKADAAPEPVKTTAMSQEEVETLALITPEILDPNESARASRISMQTPASPR